MATVNEYFPQTVFHPGTTLEEKLQEMGMSIKEFALRTEKPEKTVIAIIKGASAITHEMAIKFENTTKIPAGFWMRHQKTYNYKCSGLGKRISLSTNGKTQLGATNPEN